MGVHNYIKYRNIINRIQNLKNNRRKIISNLNLKIDNRYSLTHYK